MNGIILKWIAVRQDRMKIKREIFMRSVFPLICAGALAVTTGYAKEARSKNQIYFQGHASLRITTAENKVIYVDPFSGDGYDIPADLILVTHGHIDHNKVDLVKSRNEGCKIITHEDAVRNGEHKSFDLGYVKIEAVEAYNKNHSRENCVGYVLTFSDGVKVYFSGDTSTTEQMPKLKSRKIDYAFFCCDGNYNMDIAEAARCAKLVGAKHNIAYHMPPDKENPFDREFAKSFDAQGVIVVAPGETLSL